VSGTLWEDICLIICSFIMGNIAGHLYDKGNKKLSILLLVIYFLSCFMSVMAGLKFDY